MISLLTVEWSPLYSLSYTCRSMPSVTTSGHCIKTVTRLLYLKHLFHQKYKTLIIKKIYHIFRSFSCAFSWWNKYHWVCNSNINIEKSEIKIKWLNNYCKWWISRQSTENQKRWNDIRIHGESDIIVENSIGNRDTVWVSNVTKEFGSVLELSVKVLDDDIFPGNTGSANGGLSGKVSLSRDSERTEGACQSCDVALSCFQIKTVLLALWICVYFKFLANTVRHKKY